MAMTNDEFRNTLERLLKAQQDDLDKRRASVAPPPAHLDPYVDRHYNNVANQGLQAALDERARRVHVQKPPPPAQPRDKVYLPRISAGRFNTDMSTLRPSSMGHTVIIPSVTITTDNCNRAAVRLGFSRFKNRMNVYGQ